MSRPMWSERRARLVAIVAGVAVALVLAFASMPLSAWSPVQVTQVWWISESYSNQTGPPGGCLAGMPRATSGVSAGTSSWFYASATFTAVEQFVGSCYVFSMWVEPSTFVYIAGPPGASSFPVNGSVPVSLKISTPANPFGPGPIYIHVDTSTTPGCSYCP
ncbi:MAG: hypothetical protein L3J97_00585 [Thermoplasmata archaeon]|nr:hypothetical protein [Thermoplasmata archaeon]